MFQNHPDVFFSKYIPQIYHGVNHACQTGKVPDVQLPTLKFDPRERADKVVLFLAVKNSSIGDLVPWNLALVPLTIRPLTTLQSDPIDL